MPTQIIETIVSPSYRLTVIAEKDTSAGAPDAWRITVDDVSYDTPLEPVIGFDATRGLYYLPRVAKLTPGATVEVIATPLAAGIPTGAASAPAMVAAVHDASPESVIRNLVADVLTDSALTYSSSQVWVNRNREGLPQTTAGLLGKPGPYVEVGVPYMTGEETQGDETQTQISVPIKVVVKGDHPDRAEDAVNLAYMVRATLAEAMSLERYGVSGWTWAGNAPSDEGSKIYSVTQTMALTRASLVGMC